MHFALFKRLLHFSPILGALGFSPFPLPDINPNILPADPEGHTFADIKVSSALIDYQPFDIDIISSPAPPGVKGKPGLERLVIRGPDNDDFECFLPAHTNEKATTASSELNGMDHLAQLQKKLDPLKHACFQLQGAFWAYEVCPKRYIRQYRREAKKDAANGLVKNLAANENTPGGAINDMLQAVLGKIEREVITDDIFLGRYAPQESPDRLLNGHLIQRYIDGDRCGNYEGSISRTAEVHYECSLARSLDHIIDVTEVSSCVYVIRIGTPRACASNIVLRNVEKSIKCYPLNPKNLDVEINEESKSTTPEWAETVGKAKDPTVKDSTKKNKKDFWRQRLHDFLLRDSGEFPMIQKVLNEFMEAEHIDVLQGGGQVVPEKLLQKWLALLGVDDVEISISNDNRDKEDQNDNGSKSKRKRKKAQVAGDRNNDEPIVIRLRV